MSSSEEDEDDRRGIDLLNASDRDICEKKRSQISRRRVYRHRYHHSRVEWHRKKKRELERERERERERIRAMVFILNSRVNNILLRRILHNEF
jgi:hypothetical protein